MSDNTYVVAVANSGNSYSMTIRSLAKNPHFKFVGNDTNCIYDSTQINPKSFYILYQGCRTSAEKFGSLIEAGYKLVDVDRGLVKPHQHTEYSHD